MSIGVARGKSVFLAYLYFILFFTPSLSFFYLSFSLSLSLYPFFFAYLFILCFALESSLSGEFEVSGLSFMEFDFVHVLSYF